MGAPAHANPWLGSIIPISASALEDWDRCRRFYRSKHLLHLPGSEPGLDTGVGLLVHQLLEAVHQGGCCGQEEATRALVVDLAGPDRTEHLAGYLRRHADRCPTGATWADHEFELARFHRSPSPMWMVTGKIDAAWAVRGVLDARDYKTGARRCDRVADHVAARIQAYLLVPVAAAMGLRLRLSYEYLDPAVDEQPEPYEPEDEDLDDLERQISAMVTTMAAETAFGGVSVPEVCRKCSYAAICPDAADVGPRRDAADVGPTGDDAVVQ